MARVFLSYDRDDRAHARPIAQALEKAGHDVWWDQHISGGSQFTREIETALKASDVVVVLWSQRSVESLWVRDEAANGRDRGRLVPVSLDGTEPPLGFRQLQTVDFAGGRIGKHRRAALLTGIEAVMGAATAEARSPIARGAAMGRSTSVIAVILLVLALSAGLLAWKPWSEGGEVVLSIGPAQGSAASQTFATELATKFGALQSSSTRPVKLVEAADAKNADLAFEVAASGPAAASLVLKSPRDSSILWSMDFEHPSGKRADLVQQVTYTAARITACAMEGLSGPVRLRPAPLKAYLNACAQLSDMASFDLKPPLRLLLEVIEASPKFEPAWQALLLAETDLISAAATSSEESRRTPDDLRRYIARARKVDPTMAAADIAEAQLMPLRDFSGRMRRFEQAAARKPDDPFIVMRLASAMSAVGRQREAIELAGRAVRLDPLSPLLHSNYTALIAYSGNFDAARRELAKAEMLWPGTASLEDSQYRFHLRYGDPRIARALFDKHTDAGGRAPRMFLEARRNPGPATIEPFMTYVRDRLRNMENPSAGIGFATLAFGSFDRTEDFFTTLLTWPNPEDLAMISEVFFRPEFQEERRDLRFLRVAQRAGLLDFWQTTGKWPDFCFAAGQAYDCKAEAARLQGLGA